MPVAFTEKGLYMLATILKGDRAIQTTLAIVETFAKIRELSRTVAELSKTSNQYAQKNLMQKSGDILTDLFGEDMQTTGTETSVELNLAVLKFRHTVKREPARPHVQPGTDPELSGGGLRHGDFQDEEPQRHGRPYGGG